MEEIHALINRACIQQEQSRLWTQIRKPSQQLEPLAVVIRVIEDLWKF
jgi:hypothetical protein